MPPSPPLVATTVTELDEVAGDWDELAERHLRSVPFLRSWWLRSIRTEGSSYLLFRTIGGELVGGLALTRDRVVAGLPRLRLAGNGVLCADHLDVLCAPGAEQAVGAALVTRLTRQRHVLVDLDGLVQDSVLARSLGTLGGPAEVVDVAPYTVLPETTEDYLGTRSASTRRGVRRSDRRLDAAGAQHRRVAPPALAAAMADFRRLHEARPDRAPLLGELTRLHRAVGAGLAAGEARVDVLEIDGRPLAVSLSFVVGGRLSLYQVARSLASEDDGAGTVLLHRVIADAVRDGCREIDLLRGDEPYKASLADHRRTIHRVRFARGPVAAAALGARGVVAGLRGRRQRSG